MSDSLAPVEQATIDGAVETKEIKEMKMRIKSVLMILSAAVFLSASSFAQDPATLRLVAEKIERTNRDAAAMEKGASASPAAKALHERISQQGGLSERDLSKVMADVISAGDKSVIPYLKARLDADYGGKSQIEVVLVRLGEKEYIDRTVEELSSKDISIQDLAVWKLSMFKTKEAYRELYKLLDNETVRGPVNQGDYSVPSLASVVKDTLILTVDNPPSGAHKYSTPAWKAWFETNRQLID